MEFILQKTKYNKCQLVLTRDESQNVPFLDERKM
jgi:uncharacterized protein YqgQ